jgi:hypothetical protein
MHRNLRITGIFLAAAVLCGCTSLLNIPSDYQLDPSSGDGVAVFSVSERCPSTMSIIFRAHGHAFDEGMTLDQSKAMRPAPLQWQCGRVVIRRLRAGPYEFESFILTRAVPGVSHVKPAKPFLIPFTVTAGKATYLGHLNFDISLSSATYRLDIEDARTRDIALLKQHATHIADEDIVYDVITGGIPQGPQPLVGVIANLIITR